MWVEPAECGGGEDEGLEAEKARPADMFNADAVLLFETLEKRFELNQRRSS